MEEKITFHEIWRSAGIGGIILAAVSIVYMLIDFNFGLFGITSTNISVLVKFLIDLSKIILCIYLLRRFLIQFRDNHEGASLKDVRRFGTMVAFLSALVYSTIVLAYLRQHTLISHDAIQSVMAMYAGKLDHNSMEMMQSMEASYPTICFFSTLIYCFLVGWVLTAIMAPRVVYGNPFIDDKKASGAGDDEDGGNGNNDNNDNSDSATDNQ